MVAGSRAIVALMAEVRALPRGSGVGKVVEMVVIANGQGTEIAAKWLVERLPAFTSKISGSSSYHYVSISVILAVSGMKVAIDHATGFGLLKRLYMNK